MALQNISVRVPEDFFRVLEAEAKERGESLAVYGLKSIYARFNTERFALSLDRNPLAYMKPQTETKEAGS